MMPSKSQSFLKPSLSQLLLGNLDKLEDPKYATVPQGHFNEKRPSVWELYKNCTAENLESRVETAMITCNSKSSIEQTTTTRTKNCSKRALNWSIEPLWRYCASKMHIQLEHGVRAANLGSKEKTKEKSIPKSKQLKKAKKEAKLTSQKQSSLEKPLTASQHGKTKASKESSASNTTSLSEEHAQCSRAAFEALPPLFESRTHTLLYQNSYLLDGFNYDYGPNKKNQEQSVCTKLRLNYLKFQKSANKKSKPSDHEVIFGHAKVILNPAPCWDGSRIDWLINLEQQREARKQKHAEEEQQLKDTQESIKRANASFFKLQLKRKNKDKQNKEKVKKHKKCHSSQIPVASDQS